MCNSNPIRVIYCCNRYHLDMVKVSIHSLHSIHPEAEVTLFTIGVSPDDLTGIEVTHVEYEDVPVNREPTSIYPERHVKSAVLRLVAMDYLKEEIGTGRYLYVDSDTCFLSSIKELWDLDMGKHWLGAVEEQFEPDGHTQGVYRDNDPVYEYRMKLNPHYFNAGVLLFDVEKMPNDIYGKFIAMDLDPLKSHYLFKEQDCLNELSTSYFQLDIKYNAFYNFYYDGLIDASGIINEHIRLSNASILHFLGANKPHLNVRPVNRCMLALPIFRYIPIAEEMEEFIASDFVFNLKENYMNAGQFDKALALRIN